VTSLCETGFVLEVSVGLLVLLNCNIAPTIRDAAWNTAKHTASDYRFHNIYPLTTTRILIMQQWDNKATNLSTFPILLATASTMIWSAMHRSRASYFAIHTALLKSATAPCDIATCHTQLHDHHCKDGSLISNGFDNQWKGVGRTVSYIKQ